MGRKKAQVLPDEDNITAKPHVAEKEAKDIFWLQGEGGQRQCILSKCLKCRRMQNAPRGVARGGVNGSVSLSCSGCM